MGKLVGKRFVDHLLEFLGNRFLPAVKWGNKRVCMPDKRLHARQLAMEPLEERALLTVTWTVCDNITEANQYGSLFAAIQAFNNSATDNVEIVFDSNLANRTITYSTAYEISNMTYSLTIDGGTAGITLDGGGTHGIITVPSLGGGRVLFLNNITFQNASGTNGGAISNLGGNIITITNSTFNNNVVTGLGGAIYNCNNSVAIITIVNSTFIDNSAQSGGAIYNDTSSTMNIVNTTFTQNTATSQAGAIYNNGTMKILNSIVVGNTAVTANDIYANSTVSSFYSVLTGDSDNAASASGCSGTFYYGAGNKFYTQDTLLGENPVLANNGGPTQTVKPLITTLTGSYVSTLTNSGKIYIRGIWYSADNTTWSKVWSYSTSDNINDAAQLVSDQRSIAYVTFPAMMGAVNLNIITASAEGATGKYDGTAYSIGVTVTAPTSGTTIYYRTAVEDSWQTDNYSFDQSGTYTVYYKVEATGYETLTGNEQVIISQREVTITVDDSSSDMGDDLVLTADPTFVVSGDTLINANDLGTIVAVIGLQVDKDIPGVYTDAITASYTTNSNYAVTIVAGDYTVNKKPSLIVTSLLDSDTAHLGITLREALGYATGLLAGTYSVTDFDANSQTNNITVTDSTVTAVKITFNIASGNNTITLSSDLATIATDVFSTASLTIDGENMSTLSGSITINGADAYSGSTVVYTNTGYRAFDIAAGNHITFTGLQFAHCYAANNGGAIKIVGSSSSSNTSLNISNCNFLNNISFSQGSKVYGGAIYSADTVLTITDSNFSNNIVGLNAIYGGCGGAVANMRTSGTTAVADLFLSNTTFTSNTAFRYGGGAIFNNLGYAIIESCTFNSNSTKYSDTTSYGGAIYNAGNSDMTIVNSTFYKNSGVVNGGAITNDGRLNIINSTFYGNTLSGTSGKGGAVFSGMTGNQCYINNSILVGNTAVNGADFFSQNNNTGDIIIVSSVFTSENSISSTAEIIRPTYNTAQEVFGTDPVLEDNSSINRTNTLCPLGILPDGDYIYLGFDTNSHIVSASYSDSYDASGTDYTSIFTITNRTISSSAHLTADQRNVSYDVVPVELVTAKGSAGARDLKTMTVSATGGSYNCDGTAHGITVNVTDPATDYTIYYGEEEGVYTETDLPTYTINGAFTTYFMISASGYKNYEGSATVTIGKTPSLIVNSNSDDINFTTPGNTTTYLREALIYAERLAQGIYTSAQFASTSPDNIQVEDGITSITISFNLSSDQASDYTILLADGTNRGMLDIAADLFGTTTNCTLSIDGDISSSYKVILDGQHSGISTGIQIISIRAGNNVSISNMELQNGYGNTSGGIYNVGNLTLSNVIIANNAVASGGGGGICNVGNLTMQNVTFKQNLSEQPNDNGGAFYNSGNAYVWKCTFVQNSIVANGGAIYNTETGILSVENSLFDRNSASGNGGAIYNNGGALTIVNSTFFNNSATNGNGIYQASGATAIVNSTFYHASNSSSSFDMIGGTALLINTILVSGNAHDFKITGGTAEAYSSVITTNGISGTIALITLDELCQYKLAADVLGTSIALSADGTLIPLGSFNVSGCYVYLGRTTEQLLASVAIASVRNTDNIIEKYNNADLTVSSSSWLSSDQREVSYTDAATVGAFNLGDITATFTYYNARYDGNSHVGATVSDIIPDSGTTIWYSEDGSSYGTSSFSYAGPGSYTNYVKITALGYNDLIDQGTVLITEIPSLIVTTTDDIVLAYDGLYSLREVLGYAIQLAKGTLAETDFDTESQNSNIVTETGFTNVIISFNIDSTNLTITLDSDNGVMNVANETFIEAGYRLTLSGTNINTTSQNNITVDGGDTYRVTETTHTGTNMFWLGSGNYITISNMIFQNAYSLNSNKPGSVFYNSGNLTLSSCTISNNTLASGNGGAIYSSGTINITNCTISNNTILDTDARNSCGGSLFNTGKATISNTTFSDNNALNGGAIYIRNSASTNIENSTFSTNVAIYGGAIYNQYSSLGIKNSTFNQNGTEATTTQGGALYLYSGTTQVINSTFVANVATEKGGAVYNSGKLIILNSTFYNNGKSEQTLGGAIYSTSTSESVVANSIVIGNNGGSRYSDIYVYGIFKLYSCAVAGTSPNYSEIVIGNGSTFSDANNYFTTLEDIFGTDTPVLGDNGGQTQTLALSPDFKGLGGYLYLGYQSYYTWKIDVVRYSLSTYSATGEGYTQLYYNAAGSTFSHLLSDQRNVSYGALEGTPFLGSIGAYTLLTFAASASGVDCIYDGNAHSITVDVTVPETTGYTIKYGETSGIYNLDNSPEYTTVANPRVVYYKITEDGYRNYYGNASVKIKEVHSGIITDGSDEVNPYDNIISFREAILYKMGSFNFTQLTADAEGNYIITISNEEGLGTINIDYDVTINGTVTAEKNIIFDGASAVQLFTIAAGKEVTFTKMTIQNGNSGEYDGGAISNLGTLHLDNCVITNNQSTKNGGAIANLASAVLDINTNMTFSYNSAKNGGAIYNYTGTVTIDGADSASHFTFSNNTATYAGGAVINRSGTINISNIYFDNNTSHYNATVKNQYGHGGAVYNTDIMTITSSTFQNNKAKYANGGAIANGVGVNAATSKLTLTDVTIQNNEANYGGGIINAGNLELQGVLIQNNTAYYNGGGISNTDNEDSENEHGSIDVIGIGTTITSNQITANTATTGYGGGIISVSNTSLYLTGANLSITGNFAPNRTTGKDVSTYNVKNWPADTGTYVVTTSSALPNVVAKTSGTQTEVFYLYANDVFDYSSMSRMIKTIDEEKILSLQEDCTAKLTNLVNPLMYNYTFDVDGTKVIYRTTSLISSSDLGLTSGTYRGTLELTDLEGNSEGWGITDITLEVEAVNPTFKVQANDYLNGQILKLDINAQIASNSIQNWILNWGDGTEPTVYNREANSLAATHYYSTPGEYSLTLKVVDSLDLYCDSVWYLGTHTVFASENAPVLIPAAGNGQEVVLPSVVSRAAGDSNSPFEKEYWLALPEVYNESNFKTIVIPSHSISEQTPLYYDIDYMRPSLANQSIETNFQDSSDEEFWNPQEEYLSDLVSSQYELDDVLFDESFLTELEECGLQK